MVDTRLKYQYWNRAAVVFAFIVGVCAFILCMIVVFEERSARQSQRYSLFERNSENMDGSMLTVNSADGYIQWEIVFYNYTNTAESIHIYGGISPGVSTAPLFVPLCGTPSEYVCDDSIVGLRKGIIYSYNGESLKNAVSTIRNFPSKYYVLVDFGTHIVRMPLGINAGS